MNKRDIIHDYNEDNPHVLDMLIKEIVKQEDDQVILGNRLMMLCQVNQAWKAAVDRYFSQCEALTIEVFFSKPTDFEEKRTTHLPFCTTKSSHTYRTLPVSLAASRHSLRTTSLLR